MSQGQRSFFFLWKKKLYFIWDKIKYEGEDKHAPKQKKKRVGGKKKQPRMQQCFSVSLSEVFLSSFIKKNSTTPYT